MNIPHDQPGALGSSAMIFPALHSLGYDLCDGFAAAQDKSEAPGSKIKKASLTQRGFIS